MDLTLNNLRIICGNLCLIRIVLSLFCKYFKYYFCNMKKKCKFANPLLVPELA